MRFGVLLLGVGLLAAGCGGEAAVSGSGSGVTSSDSAGSSAHAGSECHWPASLDAATPGSCAVNRALVTCDGKDGGCDCLSNDPTMCAGCAKQFPGPLSCMSHCAANEYAVSCGGPPRADGTPYQNPPDNCRALFGTPVGNVYACCPCE